VWDWDVLSSACSHAHHTLLSASYARSECSLLSFLIASDCFCSYTLYFKICLICSINQPVLDKLYAVTSEWYRQMTWSVVECDGMIDHNHDMTLEAWWEIASNVWWWHDRKDIHSKTCSRNSIGSLLREQLGREQHQKTRPVNKQDPQLLQRNCAVRLCSHCLWNTAVAQLGSYVIICNIDMNKPKMWKKRYKF